MSNNNNSVGEHHLERELEACRQKGSEARAQGIDILDCPYDPKHGHVDNWVEKYQAWLDGWKIEDAIKTSI